MVAIKFPDGYYVMHVYARPAGGNSAMLASVVIPLPTKPRLNRPTFPISIIHCVSLRFPWIARYGAGCGRGHGGDLIGQSWIGQSLTRAAKTNFILSI